MQAKSWAERKLARVRELLVEQQKRIDDQREWIAQLEYETDGSPSLLRSARELLRDMVKTHEAILIEASAAQARIDGLLRHNAIPA